MAEYIRSPVPQDPDELLALMYDYLRTNISGWEPSDGNLDVLIMEIMSQIGAQTGEVASDTQTDIFRWFGANLVGIAPEEATAATGLTTWTMIDNAGYTIPAGTNIALDNAGELISFQTVSDVVISPGSTSAAGVDIIAVEGGTDGNDLSGTAQLLDPLDYVATITTDAATSGGTDDEEDDVYLDRLADEFRILAPRPILPDDFAVLAKRIAGVERATAINGYNPADSTYNNERMVTVAVVDEDGAAVSAPTKAAVDTFLQDQREANFVVNVIDPTFTVVNVSFTAVAWPDWTPADVEAAAEAAVSNYLDPANWGQPPTSEERAWVNTTKARYLEIAQAINAVEGLNYITALTVNGGTSDVTLSGVAPLPTIGTISGTVSAP